MAGIRKNLVYNFILSASQLLLPLISIPYITRVLNPEGVGRVSYIDSFTYYFIAIAEFGIVVYGIRAVARTKSDKPALAKLVSELLLLHIITTALTLLVYGITIFLVWDKVQDLRLLYISLAFLLVNAFACEWYYWGIENFRYITIRSIVTRLAGLLSIFILVKQPDDYHYYYLAIAGAAIGNTIWNLWKLNSQLGLSFSGLDLKRHLGKTTVTWIISLLYGLSLMLDNVLLGLVGTAAALAFYAMAIKLVRLSAIALTDTLLVFFPRAVSLLHQDERAAFQHVILQNIRIITIFSLPISAGIFLLADEIAIVFFGYSFRNVGADLRILAIIPFLKSYNLFLSKQVLLAHDKERWYVRSLLISGIIFVPATLVLSYYYSDIGASVAMVMYEASLLALNYYFVTRTDKNLIVFDHKTLLHALAGVLLFLPIIYYSRQWIEQDWMLVAFSAVVCALVYVFLQTFIIRTGIMVDLRRAGVSLFLPDKVKPR